MIILDSFPELVVQFTSFGADRVTSVDSFLEPVVQFTSFGTDRVTFVDSFIESVVRFFFFWRQGGENSNRGVVAFS